jgi:hypothetical protein
MQDQKEEQLKQQANDAPRQKNNRYQLLEKLYRDSLAAPRS